MERDDHLERIREALPELQRRMQEKAAAQFELLQHLKNRLAFHGEFELIWTMQKERLIPK